MKHQIYWYSVTFVDGDTKAFVVDNTEATVHVHKGDLYFESEAHHLERWCAENGLEFRSGTMWIELPVE
jgi:hypothetical protein